MSKAIAAAQKAVEVANEALASANAAYTQVLTTGKQSADAGTAEIIQGQKVVLDNWIRSLSLVKNGFMMTDILAGIGSLLCFWLLYKAKALPDEPTLIEQGTRLVRLVGDAFVYAISIGVTAAEKSIEGKINFVAHPLPIAKTLPDVAPVLPVSAALETVPFVATIVADSAKIDEGAKCCPVATKTRAKRAIAKGNKYDKLRRKIAQAKRRALRNELGEKGEATLARWEKELATMKSRKA